MDIGRLVERIKLSPRHQVPLSLFTGFVLFAPQRWLSVFGLVGIVSQWHPRTSSHGLETTSTITRSRCLCGPEAKLQGGNDVTAPKFRWSNTGELL